MNSIYKAKGEKIHFGEKAMETDFHVFSLDTTSCDLHVLTAAVQPGVSDSL